MAEETTKQEKQEPTLNSSNTGHNEKLKHFSLPYILPSDVVASRRTCSLAAKQSPPKSEIASGENQKRPRNDMPFVFLENYSYLYGREKHLWSGFEQPQKLRKYQ
jgi:hypothetical protein